MCSGLLPWLIAAGATQALPKALSQRSRSSHGGESWCGRKRLPHLPMQPCTHAGVNVCECLCVRVLHGDRWPKKLASAMIVRDVLMG